MPVNIGPKIGIEGEPEYRKQINNIIQQTKTLKSEMNTLTSSFDKGKASISQNREQHKLLEDQISKQKERVEALTDMLDKSREKYGENATETQKWQQAVNNAQTDLNKMQTELKNLPNSLQLVGDKLQEVGDKIKGFGENIAKVGGDMTKKITTPIVGLATAAVKTTGDFDAAMSQVSAVSGATGDDLLALREKAKEMGETTKFSASESAEAMNYMAMAGWKTEDMLNGIEGIMNLAAASGENLGTTSDIVTDALTAFGLTAADSGHFADVLAAASANANTNVGMLGESFKYVAPVAGAMGYSAEDTSFALGLMANSGIKASQAGTALRSIMTRMAKPTKESGTAMEELGLSLTDANGNMYSFSTIMQDMREAFGGLVLETDSGRAALAELDAQLADGSITEDQYAQSIDTLLESENGATAAEQARLAAMLAGKQGMSALLAIVNASDEDYEKLALAIDTSSDSIDGFNGQAEKMANVMLDNLPGQITLLKSEIEGIAIQFGEILVPIIREQVLPVIQGFLDKLKELTPEQKTQILQIAAIVAAVGPVLLIVGKVIMAVGTIISTIGLLVSGIGALITIITPIGLIVGGIIAAVIAAIVLLVTNWEAISLKIQEILAALHDKWVEIWTAIKDKAVEILTAIKNFITNTLNNIKAFWTTTWTNIKNKATEILNAIKTAISNIVNNIKTSWTESWTKIKTTVHDIFDRMREGIKQRMDRIRDSIGEVVDKIKSTFTDLIDNALDWGSDLVHNIAEGIRSAIGSVRDAASSAADAIASFLHFSRPDEGPLRSIYSWMPDMMHELATGMIGNIGEVRKAAGIVAGTIAGGYGFGGVGFGGMSADMAMPVGAGLNADSIYNAVREGASQASPRLYVGERELGRVLKDMGVVIA